MLVILQVDNHSSLVFCVIEVHDRRLVVRLPLQQTRIILKVIFVLQLNQQCRIMKQESFL